MQWQTKAYIILVIFSLILCNFVTGIGANGNTRKIDITFTPPKIVDQGDFLSVEIDEETSYLMEPGRPHLPIYTVTLTFPLATHIDDIQLQHSGIHEIDVNKQVMPSPQIHALGYWNKTSEITLDETIYSSPHAYPDTWYTFTTGGGIIGGKKLMLLSIHVTPLRYFPSQEKIQFITNITLTVKYSLSSQPCTIKPVKTGPCLVIITPLYYSTGFLRLMSHKNSLGLPTTIVTLDEIYDGIYFPVEGRDDQEKIKCFIKNAIENWGTQYILLGGGFRDIPIRQSYIPTFLPPEENFPSDLYYADIYDADGQFSSWDTNNNNIFGEYNYQNRSDETDLYPDVYLGRLACDSVSQVSIVVDKIITYENQTYGKLWFNNIVVCGGDTFPSDQDMINEGEYATEQVLKAMPSFTPTKLWVSLNNLNKISILTAINYGAGFVDFSGHGSETNWKTYFHGDLDHEVNFDIQDISHLVNREKLPILTINACLCGKFDQGNCFAWHFIKQSGGGGIASLASSGIAYGIEGNSQIERWTGWMETNFYKYYQETQTNFNLGMIWEKTIREYLNRFRTSDADYKTVEEWTLFGDPSLTIGGHSNSNEVLFQLDKPLQGYIYRKDRETIPTLFGNTYIFGNITIKVSASSKIKKVEFYIDDTLKFTDTTPPYEWKWDEKAFFLYKLRIVGYTEEGTSKVDTLDVRIFNT